MDIVKSLQFVSLYFLRSSFEKTNIFLKGNIMASKKKARNWHLPFCNTFQEQSLALWAAQQYLFLLFCSPLTAKQEQIFINVMYMQEETWSMVYHIIHITVLYEYVRKISL